MIKTNTIYNSDCLEGLKRLPDNSVHCCVTSPPYWGLRDYGVDGQLGLEETPEIFIEKMVLIFTEVKRVLRNDGTLWLNLGDSYAGYGKGAATHPDTNSNHKQGTNSGTHKKTIHNFKTDKYKPKDLVGIPWMVAFALRNSGWYLRQDIIWYKRNPMPESVTDRCTKAHEYIFLLSKSSKYYYDHESIKTPLADGSYERKLRGVSESNKYADGAPGSSAESLSQPRNNIKKTLVGGKKHKNLENKGQQVHSFHQTRNDNGVEWESKDLKANKKSVWDVPTKGYKEAHFATYPEKLIVDCIKAGCPEDGIVLDPFMGSGTTAVVSRKLNRNYIGFELNPEYIEIAERRLEKELGMFI